MRKHHRNNISIQHMEIPYDHRVLSRIKVNKTCFLCRRKRQRTKMQTEKLITRISNFACIIILESSMMHTFFAVRDVV